MASTAASVSATQLSNLTVSTIGSWADAVEQEVAAGGIGNGELPQQEMTPDGIKIVTDYHQDDEGNKVKVITKFKMVKKLVPKVVAERKKWRKFGQCEFDPPGPQVATTYVGEEVRMQFLRNRLGEQILDVVEEVDKDTTIRCRQCGAEGHWTTQCPQKDQLLLGDDGKKKMKEQKDVVVVVKKAVEPKKNVYVPPNQRENASGGGQQPARGVTMHFDRRVNGPLTMGIWPSITTGFLSLTIWHSGHCQRHFDI